APGAGETKVVQRLELPPNDEGRMRGIVATTVGVIQSLRPEWYRARLRRPAQLRVHFGHVIVLSLEHGHVWAAVDEDLLGDRAEGLRSWCWDEPELRRVPGDAYPRYRRPASRNGLYDPALDPRGDEWDCIETAHHQFLRRAAKRGRAPDHRT